MDELRENEKPIFIPLAEVTGAEESSRIQSMAKMRKLVRSVLMAKVPFVLVSLAGNEECIMSSLQMIEVAGFLGVEPKIAKEAMGRLGDLV